MSLVYKEFYRCRCVSVGVCVEVWVYESVILSQMWFCGYIWAIYCPVGVNSKIVV